MYQRLSRLTGSLDLGAPVQYRLASKSADKSNSRRLSLGSQFLAKTPRLGQTSVFFQTGLKICELPLVVKKVEDVLKIGEPVSRSGKYNSNGSQHGIFTITFPQEMDLETSEILSGFNRCFTASGIFRLLETIPAEEVTPPVAIHALNRIINFEKVAKLQNASILPGHDKTDLMLVFSLSCWRSFILVG